jgi:putative colanic acid biosynthesis glycosyltransferase
MEKVVKEKTRLGIVTVCFNDLAGLKKTAESIRQQTCSSLRWIVVDGASTDGTPDWLRTRPARLASFISEPDQGLYYAMNKGIDALKDQTDYIIFMNAGDVFADRTVLEKIANGIETAARQPVLVYGDSFEQLNGTLIHRSSRKYSWIERGMFTHHQAIFFASWLEGLRYDTRYRLSADYELIFRIVRNHSPDQLMYLPMPVCTFLMGGVSHSRRLSGIKEDYRIRREAGLGVLKSSILYVIHVLIFAIKVSVPGSVVLFGIRKKIPG